MNDKQIKIIIGSLLHDIGKVIYRSGDGRNHSESGYDFLKNEIKIADKETLNAVRFHHAVPLSQAGIPDDSIAYITYIADNISSATDRRKSVDGEPGFAINAPLESIFNILNNNNGKCYYLPKTLDDTGDINYPQNEKKLFDSSFYSKVKADLTDCLKTFDFEKPLKQYVNSILEVTEGLLTYVPSSTSKQEIADISLFDHQKLTAALASCIYEYLEESNINNYKDELFAKAQNFYSKNAFLLYSIDISGIQNFIYTINSEGALKTLRSRSFYLEIFMEAILDKLLDDLNLSRANIIYTGGGHCYVLLPNTMHTKQTVEAFENDVNMWLLKKFKTKLYIASGWSECSAKALQNSPEGSYAELFSNMSSIISNKKLKRYSAQAIINLNKSDSSEGLRECKVCKSLDNLKNVSESNDNQKNGTYCDFCARIISFSKKVLNSSFFSIVTHDSDDGLPLPFGMYLVPDTEESLRDKMQNDASFVRCYGKNKMYIGQDVSTKLWVGSYHTGSSTDQMAKEGKGIERIAVLRADIDNLGQAFVHGFERDNDSYYVTLSRTAVLSRQLSLFFKYHINHILENGKYSIDGDLSKRLIDIVYSGGDDVFVVGAWKDVIEFSVDLHNELEKFTDGTLTISAGIGIYDAKFPISICAKEVEGLEDNSKNYPDSYNPQKNAVTLFENKEVYLWSVLKSKVLAEKFGTVHEFFMATQSYGKNFLYNLLELLRNSQDKINIARFAYVLARMEPKDDKSQQEKDHYKKFSTKIYEWYKNEEDRNQLITAIYLYAYLVRINEDKGE